MFDEVTGKYNRFLEVIYIIILAASAMGDMPTISDEMTRVFKAVSIIIIAIGLSVMFISGNLSCVKKTASFAGVYAFVLVGIIVWSIFLWIVNLETIEFIIRGASKFMYQFLVLLIIFCGTYLFGERAIYSTFYGLVTANTVMMIINLGIYGPADSIASVMEMFMGSDAQEGFARAMEIHDITFAFGFYIIYYLFFARHNKERLVDLAISIFFFVLGWKRIAFAALAAALVMAVMLGRMSPRTRKKFMKFVAWAFVIFSFLYVVVTKYGIFNMIMEYYEINTMGRNVIYDYIGKYYEISFGFIGYGFEYTTVLLQHIMDTGEAHLGVLGLHNNILTVYIELGFVGFWAWLIYTWVFQLRWMYDHWGEKVAMLFFLCELYIYLTYTTDNTLYYFYSSMILRLMPMAYAFHIPYDKEIKLWPWVKESRGKKLLQIIQSA